MDTGLYRAAVAMVGQQRQMEAIASNLANLNTNGFKKTGTSSFQFSVPGAHGDVRGLAIEARVDFGQGDIERTGRELDMALFGGGFFTVDGPEGEVYTRDGAFHTTQQGALVTAEGYPVAWESAATPINPAGFPLLVNAEGRVSQNGVPIGQLKIVDFADHQGLERVRWGYWSAPRGAEEIATTAEVHQGALERSNATEIEEIIGMISAQRTFEAVARTLSSIDQSYRRLTRPS